MSETQNTTPDPDPTETVPDAPETGDQTGYAVYDETLLRFVGGVHAKKSDADKARKDSPSSHTTKVRKV